MSFDVYVQYFHAGEPAGIDAGTLRAALPMRVDVLDDDYWMLHFDAGTTTDLFLGPLPGDEARIHSLSFHRPADDAALWAAIWALLAVPGSLFHFPGEGPAWVREEASRAHVPAARGDVAIATGPAALAAAVAVASRAAE